MAAVTQITDTWLNADGTGLNATCYATLTPAPGILNIGASSYSQTRLSFVVTAGAVSVALAPNDGANPPNSVYTVRVIPELAPAWTETWFVPTSGSPVTLLDVRVGAFGLPRAINFAGTATFTVPGSLFAIGANVPMVLTFDSLGNPTTGADVARNPTTRDITVSFPTAQTGYAQLLLTPLQYRQTVSAVSGPVTITAATAGLSAIAGFVVLDSTGKYQIGGAAMSANFSGQLDSVIFSLPTGFSGTLVVLGY